MLDLISVSKAYASQVLLKDVSLRVNSNDRIGLVGANGSGKTTLFRILQGAESPDEGAVQVQKGLRIGYLAQEIDPCQSESVLGEVLLAVPDYRRIREAMEVLALGGADPTGLGPAHLADRYAELGGDSTYARAQVILGGLGFSAADMLRPLSTFSGGWHMRAKLARLLLWNPELLLLDEPTNHLDIPSMEWFEGYLKSFPGAFILISHDREFLNRTVQRIVELDRGEALQVPGTFDDYRKRKQEVLEHQARAYAQQQVRIRELEDFIARNRVRKDTASQVQSRIKQLDKIERLTPPRSPKRTLDFSFPQPPRSGEHVVRLDKVTKRYGEKVIFSNIDLVIRRGEKVALIGVNGVGKSTLLRICANALDHEEGTRELGHQVDVGYFAQHQLENLKPERTVMEEIVAQARDETVSQLRSLLGAFLFSGDDADKKVAVLSGGEKSRLALARMLMRPSNFLVMDEPTNHLDIESREVLEEALRQYQGTLLVAAHDRRFIDSIADRVLEFNEGVLTDFPGNYSYYCWKREQQAALGALDPNLKTPAAPPKTDERKDRKRREAELRQELSRRLRPLREAVSQTEAEIETLETRIPELEQELSNPDLYSQSPQLARERGEELVKTKARLEVALAQWEEAERKSAEMEALVRAEFEGIA